MAQDTSTKVFWNDEEWEQFAALLHQEYPNENFLQSPDLGNLTTAALRIVGAKMPRPRQFTNPDRHRDKLIKVYARLRAKSGTPPAQPPAHKHVQWDEQEWEEFATLLDRENAGDAFLYSMDLATLSCRALSSAGAKMRRPREFFNLAPPRARLLEAYARLRAKKGITVTPRDPMPAAPHQADEEDIRTRWTTEEWDDFAAVLHEDNPRANFMDSPDLASLTLRDLNSAAAQMGRPRHFTTMGRTRKILLETYARLRDTRPAPAPARETPPPAAPVAEPEAKPAPRLHRAPPPAPPPTPLKLDANSRPLPVPPEQRKKQEAEASPFAAVAWDRNEWLVIATELDRMYPQSKYPERAHLTGLSSEDVAFAQRLLPIERQIRHIKVASFSTLVPALKEGFEDLRRQRRALELEQGVVAEAERNARKVLDKAAAARPAPPVPAPAPAAPAVIEPAPAPIAAAPAAPVLHETVFAAAASSLIGMLADLLRPMIAELIDQALNAPPPAAATATPAAPLSPAAPAVSASTVTAPAPALPDKPQQPRMRIGIVGHGRSTYLDDLRREFPAVEFSFVDSPSRVQSVQNADRVLVLTKFISHTLVGSVKQRLTPEQFVPVHGCLSDMRRVITGLLHDQHAQAKPAIPAFAS